MAKRPLDFPSPIITKPLCFFFYWLLLCRVSYIHCYSISQVASPKPALAVSRYYTCETGSLARRSVSAQCPRWLVTLFMCFYFSIYFCLILCISFGILGLCSKFFTADHPASAGFVLRLNHPDPSRLAKGPSGDHMLHIWPPSVVASSSFK